MLVHDNSDILLRARACPMSAQVDQDQTCTVHGSVSRSFMTNEVVIKLDDGSELWLDRKDLLGYSHPTGSVRYEPFGKFFAIVAGLFILAIGGWLLIGAPRPYPRPDTTRR